MGDFFIKRIILPSGKSVEIVYFHETAGARPIGPQHRAELEVCPACAQTMVYPVSWQEIDNDQWLIDMRCPDCEHTYRGAFAHADVERFDDVLNRGTDAMIDLCELLTRENMQHDVEQLIFAINNDHILPCDF